MNVDGHLNEQQVHARLEWFKKDILEILDMAKQEFPIKLRVQGVPIEHWGTDWVQKFAVIIWNNYLEQRKHFEKWFGEPKK